MRGDNCVAYALNKAAIATIEAARDACVTIKENDKPALTAAIESAVSAHFYPVSRRHAKFGASDTEPRSMMQALLVRYVREPHSPDAYLDLWI